MLIMVMLGMNWVIHTEHSFLEGGSKSFENMIASIKQVATVFSAS